MDASVVVVDIVNQHYGVEIVRTAEDVEGRGKRCAQNATAALQTRGWCPAHLIKTFIALTQPLYSPLTALWLAISSSLRSMSFVLPIVFSIAIFADDSVIYRAAGKQEPVTKIAIKKPTFVIFLWKTDSMASLHLLFSDWLVSWLLYDWSVLLHTCNPGKMLSVHQVQRSVREHHTKPADNSALYLSLTPTRAEENVELEGRDVKHRKIDFPSTWWYRAQT